MRCYHRRVALVVCCRCRGPVGKTAGDHLGEPGLSPRQKYTSRMTTDDASQSVLLANVCVGSVGWLVVCFSQPRCEFPTTQQQLGLLRQNTLLAVKPV